MKYIKEKKKSTIKHLTILRKYKILLDIKKKINEQIEEKQKEERRWKELFNSIDQTLPAEIKDADELQSKNRNVSRKD